MKLRFEQDKLLFLLLITDIAFVVAHVLHVYTGLLPHSLFSLSRPGSYSELFQYIKELWIVLLLLSTGIRLKQGVYGGFSVLFLYFLVDDSFELHELGGKTLADALSIQPAFGLRSIDLGELIFSGTIGLIFLVLLSLLYAASNPAGRKSAHVLVRLLALLVFFGVFVDMAEIIAGFPALSRLLLIVEDGGEMVAMSLITGYVYRTQ